jgi:gluconate 2-dehydrogenase gamma chain
MIAEPAQADLPATRRRTLAAAVARILPAGDGPGAAETGVAGAVESALAAPFFRGIRGGFEQALDGLEARARALHGRAFSACAAAEQDALLRAIEEDPSPWTRFVFRSLVELSLEGFLGDPVHGGNRGFLGWEWIGLAPEDVRSGRCRGEREG